MRRAILVGYVLMVSCATHAAPAAEPPTADEAREALHRAVKFYHGEVSRHGGYVYAYSGDLKLREGEGTAAESIIWIQPPGTPTVGEAFLDAYDATGDKLSLEAARAAAMALVHSQLQSGGWFYHADFDPAGRRKFSYRFDLEGRPLPEVVSQKDRRASSGWDDWKRRKYAGNLTILDDNTTQAALRLLVRIDRTLDFKDEQIHQAALYGLESLLNAQYPSGGWSASYDRFCRTPPDAESYPPRKASFPESWPRTWPKDFTGCYVTNDELMADAIGTLLLAGRVYGERRYRAAAEKAGEFLIAAQLPEPQPAWAQQYDRQMQPVWSRAFEPPAVSGRESQTILETLLELYRQTGDKKYLEPLPRAIAYLRRSQLPDGRLARFYELQSNRPLYFTRGRDGRHQMTYSSDRLATGYGYIVDSRLEAIEAEFRRVRQLSAKDAALPKPAALSPQELAQQARQVIDNLDARGAWITRGRLRHHKVEPASGILDSRVFADNVRVLCQFLATAH